MSNTEITIIWAVLVVVFVILIIIRNKKYGKIYTKSLEQGKKMLSQQTEALAVLKEIKEILKNK